MPDETIGGSVQATNPPMTLHEKVTAIVTYHMPNPEQIEGITEIRKATADLIETIMLNCPPCADRSAAIREARNAMMTANAAIVVPQVTL